MIQIWSIVGIVIAVWMLFTGHFPLNLDMAMSGFRTKKMAFEPSGNWIRISGGLILVGVLLGWILPTGGVIIVLLVILYGASAVALAISFLKNLNQFGRR